MAGNIVPDPPIGTAFAVPEVGHPLAPKLPRFLVSKDWTQWFGALTVTVARSPSRVSRVQSSELAAAVPVTPLPISSVGPGLWRVSYHVRVTTPGTVSSSIQVVITWTDGGVVQQHLGSVLVGNSTTTREGQTVVLRADSATPISYSTAYASVGAQGMEYRLDIAAEEVALETQA